VTFTLRRSGLKESERRAESEDPDQRLRHAQRQPKPGYPAMRVSRSSRNWSLTCSFLAEASGKHPVPFPCQPRPARIRRLFFRIRSTGEQVPSFDLTVQNLKPMSRLPGLPRGAVVLKVEQDLCRLPSHLVGYRQLRIPAAYPAGPPSQPSFASVPHIGCPI
jgi:hypothetical protein